MKYDVIVVGGGIAGLTSAAYLCKYGYKVLLCEKGEQVGGLVNTFIRNGFYYDGGIRALENSGVLKPMLKQLGIQVDFVKNKVSIGCENKILKVEGEESLKAYEVFLKELFPENMKDIEKIIEEIKKIMVYMDILYGIDNPLFLEFKKDKEYLLKTIVPWMFKFVPTIRKVNKLNTPVYEYLSKFTSNQCLKDIIAQHFFTKTPSFFALSYFSLYLDYEYPKGGTGVVTEKLKEFILSNKGEIKTQCEIQYINTNSRIIKDSIGMEYEYDKLIWAADQKRLYASIDVKDIKSPQVKRGLEERKIYIANKAGGDSVLTLYLSVDIPKEYFEERCTEHFFYTPHKRGVNNLIEKKNTLLKSSFEEKAIEAWLKEYYTYTTYEISIPVMRDEALAPKGKTGLIISTLIDYDLVKLMEKKGGYEELKHISEQCIIEVLEGSIFSGINEKIEDKFLATPLTIKDYTSNTGGAITGWAFTNNDIPAVSGIPNIAKSVKTIAPNIYQAGQWTFSPSGLPISILTGKLAADKVHKTFHR